VRFSPGRPGGDCFKFTRQIVVEEQEKWHENIVIRWLLGKHAEKSKLAVLHHFSDMQNGFVNRDSSLALKNLLQLANRPKQVIVLAKCRDARYF
jgi:hypothetical protein